MRVGTLFVERNIINMSRQGVPNSGAEGLQAWRRRQAPSDILSLLKPTRRVSLLQKGGLIILSLARQSRIPDL
jgi:hypothetical protein